MKDLYSILGVKPDAGEEQIRRAYRVLARRYHPDVNPGKNSTDKFKDVAEAYETLGDPEKRKKYDSERGRFSRKTVSDRFEAYRRMQEQKEKDKEREASEKYVKAQQKDYDEIKSLQKSSAGAGGKEKLEELLNRAMKFSRSFKSRLRKLKGTLANAQSGSGQAGGRTADTSEISKISIIEVSVSLKEAIFGVKKLVAIDEGESSRKINVNIPPGVRTGSIVRLRASNLPGEELVLIIRVLKHPHLRFEQRGLIAEVPITVAEAISGASIKVPTLDEPVVLKVPPNTQSGHEVRLKGKGAAGKNGSDRGDLFIRFMIQVPESEHAVGIKEKAAELDQYYSKPVRQDTPKALLESE